MASKASITIREATKEELGTVKRLSVEELPDELNELERRDVEKAKRVFAERIEVLLEREGNAVYVATIEGGHEIAGYVWFGVSERPFSDVKVGWVYDILVVPEHRGKGIGEALLKHALEVSRSRGFELAGLLVRANNREAYSLYEKLGFRGEYVAMTREEPSLRRNSNS